MNDMAFVKAHMFVEMDNGRNADAYGETQLLMILKAGASVLGYEVTLNSDQGSNFAALLKLKEADGERKKEG